MANLVVALALLVCFVYGSHNDTSLLDLTIEVDRTEALTLPHDHEFAINDSNSTTFDGTDGLKQKRSAQPISQYGPPPQINMPTGPDDVDKIESIEIAPTQFVITTTKPGLPDRLRVRIEVTDLHDHRKLPPVDLSGLWLLITRGRYTIPFLKPDRWYGVAFRSENIIGNRPVVHMEDRLVRTPPRQVEGQPPKNHTMVPDDIYEVKMHRSLEGEENLEGLYVTARWTTPERLNGSELVTVVKVECAASMNKETIRLKSSDDGVTIEISMDHRYDLEEMNRTVHQVKVHITPLKCKRVCWRSSLELNSGENRFSRDFGEECRDIKGTTSTTYLRNIKQYTVLENSLSDTELLVETELGEAREEAFVTLSALRIDTNASEVAYKTYNTLDSDGLFRLPLEDDAVYAVQYEYTKVKPFHYASKEHFLVETSAINLTRPTRPPIETKFEPLTFKQDPSQKVRDPPKVSLVRGSAYSQHPIIVHIEPFCQMNRTQVELSDKYLHHSIDVSPLLCSHDPGMYFCDKSRNYTQCASILCYSTSMVISGDVYPADVRCTNVSQHFDLSSQTPTRNYHLLAILPLILVHFLL